jgi:hypothetical protein
MKAPDRDLRPAAGIEANLDQLLLNLTASLKEFVAPGLGHSTAAFLTLLTGNQAMLVRRSAFPTHTEVWLDYKNGSFNEYDLAALCTLLRLDISRVVKVPLCGGSFRARVSKSQEQGVWARLTPNPSIEGMPKRLRLSVTPHVKR